MKHFQNVAVVFFLCLAGCERQPSVNEESKPAAELTTESKPEASAASKSEGPTQPSKPVTLPSPDMQWLKDSYGPEAEDAIVEYLVKQSGKSLQIVPPPENIADQHYKYARMYKKSKDDKAQVYALMATHAEMARQLFKDNDPNHRRYGLVMICKLVRAAIDILEDSKLASQICDTFMWPNLDFAHKEHWKSMSRDYIVSTALYAYRMSGEDGKLIVAFKYKIEHAAHDNAKATSLARLSAFLQNRKRYQEALHYLEQIPESEMFKVHRKRIALLKKRIKENKEKEEK